MVAPELVSSAVTILRRLDRARQFFADGPNSAKLIQHAATRTACWRTSPGALSVVAGGDWIAMFPCGRSSTGCHQPIALRRPTGCPPYRNIAAPVLVSGFAGDVLTLNLPGSEGRRRMPNGRY